MTILPHPRPDPSPCSRHGCLIPGLPDHISLLCLLKVPRSYHANMIAVSSSWRRAVSCPSFYRLRRETGNTDPWLVVLSTDTMAAPALSYAAYDLRSKQLLFKVPLTLLRGGASLPFEHYRVAALHESFVLLGDFCSSTGGLYYNQMPTARSHCLRMLVCNTVTNQCRPGAAMRAPRSLFACGVIRDKLYVAGGVDSSGRAERSTEVYDIGRDVWTEAAAMPEEAAGAMDGEAVFQGKLYVRCWEGDNKKQALFWSYDPARDEWAAEAGLRSGALGSGQLLATDEFIYALGAEDGQLHRYEASYGTWRKVGQARRAAGGREALFPIISPAMASPSFNSDSQRAFGLGKDIFFLEGGGGACHRFLDSGGVTSSRGGTPGLPTAQCHRLFLGASWYRAGAIVHA